MVSRTQSDVVQQLLRQAAVESNASPEVRFASRFRTRLYIHDAVGERVRSSAPGREVLENLGKASWDLFEEVRGWQQRQPDGDKQPCWWSALRRMVSGTTYKLPHHNFTADHYIAKLPEGAVRLNHALQCFVLCLNVSTLHFMLALAVPVYGCWHDFFELCASVRYLSDRFKACT
jgi:hypothetical protein